jgi:hypothetical protein
MIPDCNPYKTNPIKPEKDDLEREDYTPNGWDSRFENKGDAATGTVTLTITIRRGLRQR